MIGGEYHKAHGDSSQLHGSHSLVAVAAATNVKQERRRLRRLRRQRKREKRRRAREAPLAPSIGPENHIIIEWKFRQLDSNG